MPFDSDDREWLEPDGLGGFASGTVNGIRTRRYHALLLTATTPPTGRMVLVNGFDAWLDVDGARHALTSQRYAPDVVHPDGASRLTAFTAEPWPTWTFDVAGLRVRQEIVVPHRQSAVLVSWRLLDETASPHAVRLVVRPFLSGRDYHATHHDNGACDALGAVDGDTVRWRLYAGIPGVTSRANASYTPDALWYRNFLYLAERERGLDDREDLMSPGTLTFDLTAGEAIWLLEADVRPGLPDRPAAGGREISGVAHDLRQCERIRRTSFPTRLERAADGYLVRRGEGTTVIAGYPWFTDWGRDTFIAMRGLCLAIGRFDEARAILLEWAGAVSLGMLPNRFADRGEAPELNAVDASLWFVVAVRDLIDAAGAGRTVLQPAARDRLLAAVTEILEAYTAGTRYGIRLDADGLLACGEPGVQLTWMDAKVGDRVVTPRIGKPVEVQALWLASLAFASRWDARWQVHYLRGRINFGRRFWNPEGQYLYDVIDADHVEGRVDALFRPNQVFAVGGLGESLIDPIRTRAVLDAVERRLLTPLGLRSLGPGEPGYAGRYGGGPAERDAAYHQGTVWPWLLGGFVQAWLAERGDTAEARATARHKFVDPLLAHLEEAGLGHVSEIADGEPPFTPRGCPFQAWSVGELLRMREMTAPRADYSVRNACITSTRDARAAGISDASTADPTSTAAAPIRGTAPGSRTSTT